MERSERAYFHLLNSMPEELRPLVRSVPQGYAFGLWDFLEKRFQNTEDDNVADLFRRWNDLQQSEEDTFDAYKARVDEVRSLLALAKEQPSERQYAYTLLDKLQPRYKQAVLALKASGQLKDAAAINWEGVVSFINTHERSEQRLGANEMSDGEGAAMGMAARRTYASAAAGSGASSPRGDAPQGNNAGQPSRGAGAVPAAGLLGHWTTCNALDVPSSVIWSATAPIEARAWRLPAVRGMEDLSLAAITPVWGGLVATPRAHRIGRTKGAVTHSLMRVSTKNRFQAIAETDSETETESAPAGKLDNSRESAMPALSVHKALASDTYGVDTMASIHCSGNRRLFKKLRRCSPVQVAVADGRIVVAEHKGEVELKLKSQGTKHPVSVRITDVYFHPSFTANLLGMVRLVREGWTLHAGQSDAYVVTPGGNKVQLSMEGDVATLRPAPKNCGLSTASQRRVYAVRGEMVCATAKEMARLHERLGHVSFKRLLQIVQRGKTLDVGRLAVSKEELKKAKQLVQACRACAEGKGTRTPFSHRGLDRGSRPFEVLHMDTYEVRVPAQPVEWALVVVDPFSEWKRFTRLQSKAQCPSGHDRHHPAGRAADWCAREATPHRRRDGVQGRAHSLL